MLLSSLYEVGRKNVWTCVHCSVKNPCRMLVASTKTRSHPSSSHQRRSSSSKSLPPPKSEHRTIDTPSETPTATKLPTAEVTKRSSTRLRRRHRDTVRDPGTKNSETWPSLPSVPSTQHLHPLDIHVASFFSIHRPISVTTAIPQTSSESTFSSIFSHRERPKHEPSNVIFTLSTAVGNLEDLASQSQQYAGTSQEHDLHSSVAQFSSANAEPKNGRLVDRQQSRAVQISLQELAKNFRPYAVPPPPVPMEAKKLDSQVARTAGVKSRPISKKDYTIPLTKTESTHQIGHKTYAARASAVTEELEQERASKATFPLSLRQPFLNHMRERQRQLEHWREDGTRRDTWRAISVKRQRRQKMKKHKYKKLMRRTRNLRRRLEKN